MLKIYGHPMSTCTRKVLTTLAETNAPFEFVTIDFTTGEHKKPAYLARQPFGQLPALEDDGFAMYESRPMCRYINEKVGGKLVPGDIQGRAVMEQWISIESANFTPHAMKFIYHYLFKRDQEPAVMEAASKGIETTLGIMDAHLAKSPMLAGEQLSIADISFMPYFEYVMGSPVKEMLAKHPHVSAWWHKVSERPSWRKVAGRA